MVKHGVNAGFTLIELLVVVAILATLSSLAAPTFSGVASSVRLTSAVDTMFSSFLLARSEAIKRNSRVVVCKSTTGESCTTAGDWQQGWIVFHDANNNATRDSGEVIVSREQSLASSVRFTGNSPVANYVSYTPAGRTEYVSGAFQAGTFTACSQTSTVGDARKIVINIAGRPRVVKTTVAQCA